jgi:hypothetical protein
MLPRYFSRLLLIAVLVSGCAHQNSALEASAQDKQIPVESHPEIAEPNPSAQPSDPVAPPSIDPFPGGWISVKEGGGQGSGMEIVPHGRTNYLLKIGDQAIPATLQNKMLMVRTPVKDYLIVYDAEEDTITMCEIRQILRRVDAQQSDQHVPPQEVN